MILNKTKLRLRKDMGLKNFHDFGVISYCKLIKSNYFNYRTKMVQVRHKTKKGY